MAVEASPAGGSDRRPGDRSPSFPFIPLQTAVDRLTAFEKHFGRHPTPTDKAGLAWGMKMKSSQADQTLSALRSFGLLAYEGSGTARQAVITEDGRTYLRAQQDSVKANILKQCALRPKMIRKFWTSWGSDRPHEAVALDELTLKNDFSDAGAETFLKVYDATIAYAGLTGSDTVKASEGDKGEEDELPQIAVGDYVTVEVAGQSMFAMPVRVRAVTEYEGKPWFYVDGSEAAVSMDHIQLHQKGHATTMPPALPIPPTETQQPKGAEPKGLGWKEERLIDDAGEETFLSYKGEPSVERYEFIRDYLDFRIQRLKK